MEERERFKRQWAGRDGGVGRKKRGDIKETSGV
jgi:hypothetical protein